MREFLKDGKESGPQSVNLNESGTGVTSKETRPSITERPSESTTGGDRGRTGRRDRKEYTRS